MYICIAPCPELDLEGSKHCVVNDPNEMYEQYVDGCPCGNITNWVEKSSISDEENLRH